MSDEIREEMNAALDKIEDLGDELMLLKAQLKAAKNKYARLARSNPAIAKELGVERGHEDAEADGDAPEVTTEAPAGGRRGRKAE